MWTCANVDMRTCGDVDMRTCGHADNVDILTCRYADMATFGHVDMRTCRPRVVPGRPRVAPGRPQVAAGRPASAQISIFSWGRFQSRPRDHHKRTLHALELRMHQTSSRKDEIEAVLWLRSLHSPRFEICFKNYVDFLLFYTV